MSKVLALIPARKGSRGIEGKNIREIAGRPLLAWSILAAQNSKPKMRIICSTDDEQIAEVARSVGAEVPFLRPPELATDESSTIAVAEHVLDRLGESFDHLLLLQPTSPLRLPSDIDESLTLACESGTDAVVGVCEAQSHPYLTYVQGNDGLLVPMCRPEGVSLRRQDLPSAFVLNGAIYVNRVESLLKERTFFPKNSLAHLMPQDRSVDVDTWDHWEEAERRLRQIHG